MSCPCLQSNPIPTCIEELTIGVIDKINTPVVVFITNIATGRIQAFETMSDGDGLVTIDVSEFEINDNTNYKVQIYTASDMMGEAETITIDDTYDSCVYFTGEKLNGIVVTEANLSTLNNSSQPSSLNPIYHFTSIDYSVPSYIRTVGVDATASIVHVYLGNPNIYTKGLIMTVSDEALTASVNTIVVHGAFDLGNPQIITSDGGSVSFYSNGTDSFIKIASN